MYVAEHICVHVYVYTPTKTQITADGEAVRQLQPDISRGEYLVTGLDPDTSYQFASNIINVFGQRFDNTDAVTTVGMWQRASEFPLHMLHMDSLIRHSSVT